MILPDFFLWKFGAADVNCRLIGWSDFLLDDTIDALLSDQLKKPIPLLFQRKITPKINLEWYIENQTMEYQQTMGVGGAVGKHLHRSKRSEEDCHYSMPLLGVWTVWNRPQKELQVLLEGLRMGDVGWGGVGGSCREGGKKQVTYLLQVRSTCCCCWEEEKNGKNEDDEWEIAAGGEEESF